MPKTSALAREKGPIALKRAAREPFVGFSRYEDRDYFDRTAALCMEAGFSADIRHEAGGFTSVLAMVACGLGAAIVPASCATPESGRVVFRRIQSSRYKSRLVLIGAEQRDPLSVAGKVTGLVVAELKSLGRRLR